MILAERCRQCGAEKIEYTSELLDGSPVDVSFCPQCDRLGCGRCGFIDITGIRRKCGNCGGRIDFQARGRRRR